MRTVVYRSTPHGRTQGEIDAAVEWCAHNGLDAHIIPKDDFYITREADGSHVAHFRTFTNFAEPGEKRRRGIAPDGNGYAKGEWQEKVVEGTPDEWEAAGRGAKA